MAMRFETSDTSESAVVTALSALRWTLEDERRSSRLLALTGLGADDLRSRLGDPTVLAEILLFLESHEPDLIACAAAIGNTPDGLVNARRLLQDGAQ